MRVWLATGHTDMRKGFATLALLVQEKLKTDLCSGAGDEPRYTARSTITPEPLAKLQRD